MLTGDQGDLVTSEKQTKQSALNADTFGSCEVVYIIKNAKVFKQMEI